MTEEERIAAEAAAKEVTPPQDETAIDYKALYEKEKEELDQAKYTLTKKNIESKNKQPAPPIELPDVAEIVRQEVQKGLSSLQGDILEDELLTITNDPDERNLIRLKYESAINKTGFTHAAIRNDLLNAKLLANAPKYQTINKEMAEALKSKKGITPGGSGSNQDPANGVKVDDLQKHFKAADWTFMKNAGWSDEKIKRAIPKQG